MTKRKKMRNWTKLKAKMKSAYLEKMTNNLKKSFKRLINISIARRVRNSRT